MYQNSRIILRQARVCSVLSALACNVLFALSITQTSAQSTATASPAVLALSTTGDAGAPLRLKDLFDAAWQRQPEALSLASRKDAADSRRQAAQSWTQEPAAMALSAKTDRLNRNRGSREYEVGIGIPLWLPGERARTGALADAEARGVDTRVAAAKLRVAASVREAYWAWERARIENYLARDRFTASQALATDVAGRVKAGYLARADQHQADGAAATAESAVVESESALVSAAQQLRALTGRALPSAIDRSAPTRQLPAREPTPELAAKLTIADLLHPALADWVAQAEVARQSMALARVQSRANPELRLSTISDRGAFGDASQQSLTIGVRIPFGSDSRHRSKVAAASAHAIEIEGQLNLERERILAQLETARQRVDFARAQADIAGKRDRLAGETRSFFQKSFRLGESDLPTQLRVNLEAAEAARQAARAQIEYAASVSALRQALGLLPER